MTHNILIVDAQTGEQVIRELNADELAQQLKDEAAVKEENAKQLAQITAKQAAQAKLKALGLTSADLKALGLQVEISTPTANAD
jgi:hypothetical protein